MENELQANLVEIARLFGDAKGWELSTVGKNIAGDGRFFASIQQGRTFTVRRYDDLIREFSLNWPAELDWPAGIVRPAGEMEAAE